MGWSMKAGWARRVAAMVTASVIGGLVTIAPPPATAAGHVMTPSSTTVTVGSTVDVDVSECPRQDGSTGWDEQIPAVWLITGTGASAAEAARAWFVDDHTMRIRVPGWVDPADQGTLAGACDQYTYSTAHEPDIDRVFTFDDVSVDVLAAGGPVPYLAATPSRTTAAGGQAIGIAGQGCAPPLFAYVSFHEESALDGRDIPRRIVTDPGDSRGLQQTASGQLSGRLPLIDAYPQTFFDSYQGEPLAPGTHRVEVVCADPNSGHQEISRPFQVTVTGPTKPSDSIAITGPAFPAPTATITGTGCFAGSVTLRLRVKPAHEPEPVGVPSVTVTPASDGTWSYEFTSPDFRGWFLESTIASECGDALQDGFVYVPRAYQPIYANLRVTEFGPSSTPAPGSALDVVVQGSCTPPKAGLEIWTLDAKVVLKAAAVPLDASGLAGFHVAAPADVGEYALVPTCGGIPGEPARFRVAISDDGTATPATPLPGNASFTG